MNVRVRFAPSPTGPLHIGGVRTALYNYLFARHHQGTFILRIEDTDQTRYIPGAEKYIFDCLEWLGISYDEGPGTNGQFAPYRQSERKEIYKDFAQKMLQNGNAYLAFDTPEELEAKRLEFEKEGKVFKYDQNTRNALRNSLSLPADEVKRFIRENVPSVVRIKIPENREIHFYDLIRGEVVFQSCELDDKVLLKTDGLPTYHLANVTDDYLMKITHVIRGEEWLPSTPLHVLIYEFLGYKDAMPQFAHLPLILKPNGKGKLSKRDGDAGGFPVFLLEWTDPVTNEKFNGYRESGYLPEAVINLLSFLGWNPGTEQEIFSLEELIQNFSLERVGRSGSHFDPEKAKWYNHQYIQKTENEILTNILREQLSERKILFNKQKLPGIISLVKDRLYFTNELFDQTIYFFCAPVSYDEDFKRKKWKEKTNMILSQLVDFMDSIELFNSENLNKIIKEFIELNMLNMGDVMNPLRLCLVGKPSGIHLIDLMEVLGKHETINRIKKCLDYYQTT